MRSVDTFLIQYAALTFLTVTILAILGVDSIDIYAALLIIEFLVASELSSYLTAAESTRRNIVAVALLLIFAGIITVRIINILQ
jgi:hypothetical protein